jgi:hypothetical protein
MDEYIIQINKKTVKNPTALLYKLREHPLVARAKDQPYYYGSTVRNHIYKVEGLGGLAAAIMSMKREGVERIVVRCMKNGKNN